MCGFVALFQKNGEAVQSETLDKMTQIILHRGPDDAGIHIDKHVGLGFRRLSIIDLEKGAQPLSNETGDIWIVFNGEIYNYQELKTWLKDRGHEFKTDSDTETIVHLYEEVGTDCPRYLRGMFGFAIWDRRKQRLFGARDHFGIKPVYWTETPSGYGFASEIKSLLEMDEVRREVNPTSFFHYLTFQYVPDPETMFQGIHKLEPGHSFTIENGQLSIQPYWQVEFEPDESKPFSYFVEGTRAVLEDSVAKHRISDVPRGAFLSSGVDSSTIAGLLKKHEDVKTFTVGFDIPGYSELDYARRTAKHLGTDHHEVEIKASRYLEELPRLIWHQDDPVADPSAIALYFVAELASRHITVVLSGEGADEFFGGYNIYREPGSLRMFSYLPKSARRAIGKMATRLPEGMKGRNFLIRGSKTVEERFFGNAFIFDEALKETVTMHHLESRKDYQHPHEITRPIFDRAAGYDDETKMQYLDIHTWLRGNILMKADKMTMANSLELRVPFIDTKVFEFAATIPTKYKIANGTTKHVLREAMKDFLPDEIKTKKKLGFPVPTRHWLKHDFYDWAKELIYDSQVDYLINKAFVMYMLDEHKEGKADYSRKLWTLLVFMLWHQIYIEQKFHFKPYVSPYIEERRNRLA
ncbi:MAG: asparagine synthase (glutamine-hydrolyzing) [Bacillaceae bacterium]|nr:asparagine synthase (glutamine-hydrolyzing) [Bacillaceae bacterium]